MTIGSRGIGNPVPVTGTGSPVQITARDGGILGFLAVSGTTPTLQIYDNNNAGTANPILPLMTIVPGNYYSFPVAIRNGITLTLTASAVIVLITD